MNNLVIVSGDFSSGTTLLFTLFRKTGDFYCLYEPLHEKLLEYLIYPLRPDPHHPFVEPYFTEYKGFRDLPRLFRPEWATRELSLPPDADAPELYRYLSYLIGVAFGRKERVMLKENRFPFRLGWLRANFPSARIVHIYRDREDQWKSIVRRGQEYVGREDIGQHRADFAGFSVAAWCDDLAGAFPELEARHFANGHDRFARLWELSYAEQHRYADVSISLAELTGDFEATCARIGAGVGYEFDAARLKAFVVQPENRARRAIGRPTARQRIEGVIDRLGQRYARARLGARSILGGERGSAG